MMVEGGKVPCFMRRKDNCFAAAAVVLRRWPVGSFDHRKGRVKDGIVDFLARDQLSVKTKLYTLCYVTNISFVIYYYYF